MNKGQINLIYFGRITKSKNINVIIKVLAIIIQHSHKAHLDLIGGYADGYKRELDAVIKKECLPAGSVEFHGSQSLDYIADKLRCAHYFLFPSEEIKEGHSNSLTEAMAYGVVPIVSNAGFSASICGDDRLVVPCISPEEFARRIIEIENLGNWESISHFVYNRVVNRYTEVQALDEIKEVIKSLDIQI